MIKLKGKEYLVGVKIRMQTLCFFRKLLVLVIKNKVGKPCGTNHSKGVLILISEKLDINIIKVQINNNGRYIMIECDIQRLSMTLINAYFPVRGQELEQTQFLQE